MRVVVSSNLTLFLKYVLPGMFAGLLLPFIIFIFLNDGTTYKGDIPLWEVRLLLLSSLLTGLVVLGLTSMQLVRVELDLAFMYVTNYWSMYKYPYHNIERVEDRSFFLLNIRRVHFKVPGHFGKSVVFLAGIRYDEFLEEFPEVANVLKPATTTPTLTDDAAAH